MHRNPGDETPQSGSMMPPAITQREIGRTDVGPDARLAPPFVGGRIETAAPQSEATEEAVPWDALADDEGVVEPVFEADSDAVLAELTQQAKREEFPLDAFIIPEQAQRVPTGLEGNPKPTPAEHTPVTNLADRLEKLSHRLRVENSEIVVRRLAAGDKLDTLLAGLLAGYLGASE